MSEHVLTPLFSRERIQSEIERLASEIRSDYGNAELLLVGVLKGSFLFVADLARAVGSPATIDFVRLASYGSATKSSGIVEFRQDLEQSIKGRDVIIVEDIVDSGYTLEALQQKLLMRQPRSLRVCTLIDKRARRDVEIEADYVGISIEDGFIVGYGLDYNERYRELSAIYTLSGV